jgi:hypothetical protein
MSAPSAHTSPISSGPFGGDGRPTTLTFPLELTSPLEFFSVIVNLPASPRSALSIYRQYDGDFFNSP